jgi:protein tyrosine phosphatase
MKSTIYKPQKTKILKKAKPTIDSFWEIPFYFEIP